MTNHHEQENLPTAEPLGFEACIASARKRFHSVTITFKADNDVARIVVKGTNAADLEIVHVVTVDLNIHGRDEYEHDFIMACQAADEVLSSLTPKERYG